MTSALEVVDGQTNAVELFRVERIIDRNAWSATNEDRVLSSFAGVDLGVEEGDSKAQVLMHQVFDAASEPSSLCGAEAAQVSVSL